MTKIRRVDAYPLRYPEPHDHNNIRYITLARVEAEGGAVGWGECISQFPESAAAVKTIIERGYAPHVDRRERPRRGAPLAQTAESHLVVRPPGHCRASP